MTETEIVGYLPNLHERSQGSFFRVRLLQIDDSSVDEFQQAVDVILFEVRDNDLAGLPLLR